MTAIDFLFLILLAVGAVSGFLKGFVRQLATLFGLIAGLFVAKALYLSVAGKLAPAIIDSMTAAQIIAFIAIWVLVPLVCTIIASLLTRFLEAVSLGGINKLLGLLAGMVLTILILSMILNIIDFLDPTGRFITQSTKHQSVLYYFIKDIISYFFPVVQEITEPFIAT